MKANDEQKIYAKESGEQISQYSAQRDLSFGPIDPEPEKIDLLPNEIPKTGH